MTISNTSRTAGPYVGTGANNVFPFSFKVFARSDLLVATTVTATSIETVLVLDAGYTVLLNANQNATPGGIITLSTALPVGTTLAATSNLPIQQSLELTNQGGFYPTVINDALDRIVITIQQLAARVGIGALNVGAAASITAILSTLATLVSGAGAALVGFLQLGVGAVLRTVLDKLRDVINSKDYGVVADGVTDDTAALQKFVTACAGRTGVMQTGTILFTRLTLPSNIVLDGQGFGTTTLKMKNGTNQNGIVNSDSAGGNVNISLRNFTLDGNYAGQTASASGVVFSKVTNPYLDIEVKNCRGTGVLMAGGSGLKTSTRNSCTGNGKTEAGYGLYVFNHDNADVYGEYDDNCIGVAVEASGAGATSNNARVSVRALNNRADFTQSGAGVHFEQSAGGVVANAMASNCVCAGSTGVGINNTSCSGLVLTGNEITNNVQSGISSLEAYDVIYTGNKLLNNGAGAAPGYQAAMYFDVGGSGLISGNYVRGSTPDGLKSANATSNLHFIGNDVSGFTNDHNVVSVTDVVSLMRRKSSYAAVLTGCATAPTGTVTYDINGDTVTITIPSILATSNSTAVPTLTGMPAAARPASSRGGVGVMANNGANNLSWVTVAPDGTISFAVGTTGTATATGTKGVQPTTLSYRKSDI